MGPDLKSRLKVLGCPRQGRQIISRSVRSSLQTDLVYPSYSLITNALLPKKRPAQVGVLPKNQISENVVYEAPNDDTNGYLTVAASPS